uniref:BED-type domain-containing protein n=1 Tax=Kalanchoe fedtschenkoi TaxID=63787 RepID=A0A7N0ZWF9_KALFE
MSCLPNNHGADKETLCLKCGVQGITEALVFCTNCKLNAEHYYCLDQIPNTFDLNVQWVCHECKPRISFGHSDTHLLTKDQPSSHENCRIVCDSKTRTPNHEETDKIDDKLSALPDCPKLCSDPIWRGSICTHVEGSKIVYGVAAHLPNKQHSEIARLVNDFPATLITNKIPQTHANPKHFNPESLTIEDIDFFFLPSDKRYVSGFKELVNHMRGCDLVLTSACRYRKFLIFTSLILPLDFQRIDGSHYLWGVFLRDEVFSNVDPFRRKRTTKSQFTKEKMQAGLAHSKEIEKVDCLDIVPMDSENHDCITSSSSSLEFSSDTDNEQADKAAENSKKGKHKEYDIAWSHAVKIQKPKLGLVCKYCSRAMTGRGRITRLKEHLAGGFDFKTIKACPSVPLEVKESMKKILEEKERKKALLIAQTRANGEKITDLSRRLKVRKDAAWDYAFRVDGKVNSMVCKFCSQMISGGGITRFKHHLSEKCIEAPPEVQKAMEKVLIKKDIVRAKLNAKVDKIKRQIRG